MRKRQHFIQVRICWHEPLAGHICNAKDIPLFKEIVDRTGGLGSAFRKRTQLIVEKHGFRSFGMRIVATEMKGHS
jgi:hypothetical protein